MTGKAWKNGSTTAHRKARAVVLARDGWVCQLCGKPIPKGLHKDHPQAAQVHHTQGRAKTGDNPTYMVAAHRACNLEVGDPSRMDPPTTPRTQW